MWRRILAVIFLLVVGFYLIDSFGRFTYAEMDWNRDGTTTIGEILDAGNYGMETDILEGRQCHRVYALKDGANISLYCEDSQSE